MNYTKASYKIGLLNKNFAWETLLLQEGNFFKIIEAGENLENYNLIIITSTSKIDFSLLSSYLKKGGAVLCETKKFAELSNKMLYSKKVRYKIAESNSFFSSVGLVDIDNFIYFTDKLEYLDKNLKISYEKIEKGHLLLFPFDLKDIFSNHKFSRKKFYFPRKELPSEDVSNVSKYKFLKLVSKSLEFLFDKMNLPYITKWFYEKDYKNVFIFRVDTDFCKMEDAKALSELIQKYKIPTTWFVDTNNSEMIKNFYSKLPDNNEIAFHSHRHLVFKDIKQNKENIAKGLEILNKFGIYSKGFSAPFGEWNISLQKAIEQFDYSSDFAYDYDNFPSYPYVAENFSETLQIPPHPISVGRLIRSHFSQNEMIDYYFYILNYLKNEHLPIIFYHHPHHKYFEVFNRIFKKITDDNKIKKLTMYEFYTLWRKRLKISSEIFIKKDNIEGVKQYIRVIYKNKISLTNKDSKLSDLNFKEIKQNTVPKYIKRIRKVHWRDFLYDYEKKRSKSRL